MACRFGLVILISILISASLALSVCGYTPVNVMMPLNIMNIDGTVNNAQQLQQQLTTLKQKTNVDGILLDVWFGIVERNEKQYDWNGYKQLVQLFRQVGLGVKVVLSFHQCGGNVGDACNIPLPKWVTSVGPDAFYTDREGRVNYEYISGGADEIPLWNGRTATAIYSDFMISFRDQVLANNTDIISLVEISLGPAGELRYPSYPSKYWNFCGVGEFQCYDKYMLANLSAAASAIGHPEWGHGGPGNAGQYSHYPQNTGFFNNGNDNYQSPYGRFFLDWYFNVLLNHADVILGNAANIFSMQPNTTIAAKISGVHWWYKTDHHAAELTAGYYNTNGQNPYLQFARLFAKHKVAFEFTCMEMKDQDQPAQCQCGPEELVSVTHSAAQSQGVVYGGENALPVYDTYHYGQIEYQASQHGHIGEFTYLRFSQDLLNDNNIGNFADFVNRMHNI